VDESLNSYDFHDNTAFEVILTDPTVHMFASNYLRVRAFLGQYKNANPRWREYYRATVVVPITMFHNPAEIKRETVVGFLCIDSIKARFDRRDSLQILKLFCPLLWDTMVTLSNANADDI
jgi:hypothetical protein